ncbi:2'-5' RNA ligase superfamily protein [Kordia sp. SMS9]|uniref:2'-5' RNA ligase family protein n=1 Tax=Kordia sp. SMS9 TaxID=2282170 RepID=UPI000E0D020B|nr:2'-5' RNA ligase family protein [Kordia sp. SMS9]AXG68110.1 2'-5' RNA ligase superfamily protein [Kordia sp. SMS9]
MAHKTSFRKQLTLFVNTFEAIPIENIRAEFNPKQYGLIPAHVTLCREDEIEPIATTIKRLQTVFIEKPLRIEFEKVQRFANGKGVFMPCSENYSEFIALRKAVLGQSELKKAQIPHITLMHPRNATCTDATFAAIQNRQLPRLLTFTKISLIAQKNGGKWHVLNEFEIVK